MVEQGHGSCAARRAKVVDVQLCCLLDFGRNECSRVGAGIEHAGSRAILVRHSSDHGDCPIACYHAAEMLYVICSRNPC